MSTNRGQIAFKVYSGLKSLTNYHKKPINLGKKGQLGMVNVSFPSKFKLNQKFIENTGNFSNHIQSCVRKLKPFNTRY